MIGTICWVISAIFTVIVAYLITSLLRSGQPSLDLALFLFNWVFFVTLSMLLSGLTGWLKPIPIGISSLAGLTVLLSIPATRAELRKFHETLIRFGQLFGEWWVNLERWVQAGTVVFVSISIFRFAFLTWALPPFIWDSLTYHLTNVAQWIQDASIHVFITPVERIYSAANYEVYATWFSVFIHHDVIIEAAVFPAYLIAGFSAYYIARWFGIGRNSSWIATLAYLSTPALTMAIPGTKNDPIMAAIYLLAIALCLELSKPREGKPNLGIWSPMFSLWLVLAYAVGTKVYIVHLLPGILIIALFSAVNRFGISKVRTLPKDIFVALSRESRMVLLLVGFLVGSATFLGVYWYVRNWLLMGNPFFPYSVRVGQSEILPSDIAGFEFSFQNLFNTLWLFFQRFGDKQYLVRPDLPYTTGWGWIAYGMGIPAALWAFMRRRSFRGLIAGFLLSFLVLLFSSPTSPWNMRYVIWFPVCLAIAIGFVFDQFFDPKSRAGVLLLSLFTTLAALNFLMVITYNSIRIQDIWAMLNLPFRERNTASFSLFVPPSYQEFINNVPAEALLGYNLTGNGFVYPLYRADFSQRIVYIPINEDDRCEDIIGRMLSQGTRYLFTAPVHTLDEIRGKLNQCSQGDYEFRELGLDLYVIPK